jgi:CheY-like chemotaxis protein
MQAPDSSRGVEPSIRASTVGASQHPIRTILLVEDEAFVREVACEILRVAGYRVLSARNAAEAVPAFLAHREEVELLLTDVVLPDRNGPDLAFELVTLGRAFRTIFISGYPENSVTRNGVQKPGWSYLPKPFSATSLLQKVNEVMSEASS